MKRLFFRGKNQMRAAEIFFSDREEYCSSDYEKYTELEVVVQEDGRYSVWGNLEDDADLLQDTRKDSQNLVSKILLWADEIQMEE